MDSISFDFAADIYDATRGFPEGIAAKVADSLLSALGETPTILEVGIGTGRITRPLLEQIASRDAKATGKHALIFGADISERMLSRLRAQLPLESPQPSLIMGSGLALPFPDSTFDAVLMVHLIHLIKDWKAAILESHRVLNNRGALLIGYESSEGDSPISRLRKKLHDLILENYPDYPQFGPSSAEERTEWLLSTGAMQDTRIAASWVEPIQLNKIIDTYAQGIHSATWRIPEEKRKVVISQLRAWALAEYGSLEEQLDIPHRFVWERFRWEGKH